MRVGYVRRCTHHVSLIMSYADDHVLMCVLTSAPQREQEGQAAHDVCNELAWDLRISGGIAACFL